MKIPLNSQKVMTLDKPTYFGLTAPVLPILDEISAYVDWKSDDFISFYF